MNTDYIKIVVIVMAVLTFMTGAWMSYLVNNINKDVDKENEDAKKLASTLYLPILTLGIIALLAILLFGVFKYVFDKDNNGKIKEKYDIKYVGEFLYRNIYTLGTLVGITGLLWFLGQIIMDNATDKNINDETKNDKHATYSQILTTVTAVTIPLIIFLT